jgi:2-oxoglutarate dehydrogenase complex dehydrogenase (E1) component-like enzyme
MANLDPLGLDKRPMPIELDPALYGFSEKDLDRECAPVSSGNGQLYAQPPVCTNPFPE